MTKIIQIMHPHTDMGAIATDFRLCDARYAFQADGKDERALAFEAKLAALDGIKKAEMDKHEIHFERHEAFDWTDLFALITPMVIAYMNDSIVLTTDDRRKNNEDRISDVGEWDRGGFDD